MNENAPLARYMRFTVILGLLERGVISHDEARDALIGPIALDNKTTVLFDDSGLIDATPTEAMNAIYGDEK